MNIASKTNCSLTKNHGFTLIELLVVIAIIALLAAILFPVFAQARAKARQATCTSNIRQLTISVQLYQQDFDSCFPFWVYGDSSKSGEVTPNHLESLWLNSVLPYVKNGDVFMCPSATNRATLRQNNVWDWTDQFEVAGIGNALKDKAINYGLNEVISNGSACGDNGPCSDASVDHPASTMLIADCLQGLSNSSGGRPDRNNPNDPLHQYIITRVAYANGPDNCYNMPLNCGASRTGTLASFGAQTDLFEQQTRHSKGSVLGFADGHAKWLAFSRITYDLLAGDGTP